jgi:hypothetical protein
MGRAEPEGGQAGRARHRRRRRRSSHHRRSTAFVVALAVAAAVGGALAGCHPTGVAVVDALYGAALAALVTVAASRARRSSLLVMAAVGFAMSRSWLWLPAGAALALAFASVFQRRSYRRTGALVGAVAVQALLRWPHFGFHGLTALVAAAAMAPVLVSAWRRQTSNTRRIWLRAALGVLGLGVVLCLPALVTGFLARGPVTQSDAAARDALKEIEAGQGPAAAAQLKTAASAIHAAHGRVAGWWDLGAYVVPGMAQQQRAIYYGTKAGQQLTAAAAGQAQAIDFTALRYRAGRVDLSAIASLGVPLARLQAAVGAAQATLSHSGSPWLAAPIASRVSSLGTQLARAAEATSLATAGVQAAPGLLGGDGTRHYLVAFMTPAETRGLGGFIGAYGELTVGQGRITLTRSGRAIDLTQNPSPAWKLTGPPAYLARYGTFAPQDNFEDLTYSPDFPTVDQVISELYPQVGGDQIDGVMVVDPAALAALLRFTGPISVPGLAGKLTAANAADVLLRQQYLTTAVSTTQRHDLLQDALAVGFERLTSGSLPLPKTLGSVLGPEVRQGRLLFWSNHPGEQSLLHRLGLDGSFPTPGPGSDVVAVTVANAANSKIDAYLHEQVTDHVRYDPATGHVSATVAVTLHNAAPSTGLPGYVIGSYQGSGLPPGTSFLWLSLYSPLLLTESSVDGHPIGFSPGIAELGVQAYSTFVTIPAESTSTLTVTLDGSVTPGPDYHLTVRLQPLANPQSVSVSAEPTAGWVGASPTTWTAGTDEVQRHSWAYKRV